MAAGPGIGSSGKDMDVARTQACLIAYILSNCKLEKTNGLVLTCPYWQQCRQHHSIHLSPMEQMDSSHSYKTLPGHLFVKSWVPVHNIITIPSSAASSSFSQGLSPQVLENELHKFDYFLTPRD